MKYIPHEYQAKALDWVLDHPRCCLFLDMGLGKSVITLTAIKELRDNGDVSHVLIVAPKKVAETTWTEEAAKWDHLQDLKVTAVLGTAKQRMAALAADSDIHVIGRDNLDWLVRQNLAGKYDMFVLDELTSFKSPRSNRFKAARRLTRYDGHRVVGLTGTPAPNGLLDLWAEMQVVDKGECFGYMGYMRYRDRYFSAYMRNGIPMRVTVKPSARAEINSRLSDTCMSMKASDWLSLPPVMEHTVKVRLSDEKMRRYTDFERERVMEFDWTDERAVAANAAALLNKLSQFANGSVYDDDGNAHLVHTEKAEALAELVEQAKSPVLVFYQYRHDLPPIMDRLKGLRVREYRDAGDLEAWNSGGIDVLLAHPASTCYGLNMQQGGCYVVWYGTGWNLEHYQQGNARIHRQGQTRPVTVYRLVCEGTVDERALWAISGKKKTQDALIEGLNYLRDKYKADENRQAQESEPEPRS